MGATEYQIDFDSGDDDGDDGDDQWKRKLKMKTNEIGNSIIPICFNDRVCENIQTLRVLLACPCFVSIAG
jgi:hypothetical protein